MFYTILSTFKKTNFLNELNTIKFDTIIPSDNNTQNIVIFYFLGKSIYLKNIIIISNGSNIFEQNNSFILANKDPLVPESDLVNMFIEKQINNTNHIG